VQHFGECLYMIWCTETTMYNNVLTQMQDEVLPQHLALKYVRST